MQIILRCVLDTEEDVLRDISISDSQTLEQLHDAIIESFELNPGEMAAFYKTNDDWDQGEEIPLIPMNEREQTPVMNQIKLAEICSDKDSKLIYVYDFLKFWTFYVIVHDLKPDTTAETQTTLKVGTMPKDAQDKHFEANLFDSFDNFDDNEDLDPFDEDYPDYV